MSRPPARGFGRGDINAAVGGICSKGKGEPGIPAEEKLVRSEARTLVMVPEI